MRILNVEPGWYSAESRRLIESAGTVDYVECADQAAFREQLVRGGYDALFLTLGVSVDAALLDAVPSLRWIVSPTTGSGHIDTAAAAARGVRVLTLRGETAFLEDVRSTAEHTWGLLLALMRRIPASFADVRGGAWRRQKFLCSELHGKTLGIVGYGRLGRMVARYGVAFGMRVWACDRETLTPAQLAPGVEHRAGDELLCGADVVSLHLPLEPSTAGYLSRERIAAMTRGALLINTARGELVDEDALVDALEEGRLAGAAVDVLDGDSLWDGRTPAGSRLLAYAAAHDNLIVTPHTGGYALEAIQKTRAFIARRFVDAVAADREGNSTVETCVG